MKTNKMYSAVRGFTLIEMVMVVVLVGILMSVALPFFRTGSTKSSVRGAMDAIGSLHAVAKATAIQRGRFARLVMIPGSATALVVANRSTGTVLDTIGSVENLGTRFSITFTTTRDTLVFTPRGIGAELSGTTIIIIRGDFRDTITISAAGRLTR
ncbi:MAG: GspH/FimT family pseudopilin [Gemmatimonadota bacterium]|jgi:prepilin-type N-terminal cleavage/methylation domain-containing protein